MWVAWDGPVARGAPRRSPQVGLGREARVRYIRGVFLRKAALRPVPKYAVVEAQAIEAVEQALEDDEESLQEALDTGYRDLDRRQPVLAGWLAEEVAHRADEMAQSLGYFLAVTVFMAFREAFPTRLGEVDEGALQIALDTLEADEELRADDPLEVLDSDDVVGMTQPALIDWVQHHLQEALEQSGDDADLDDLDRIYRAILVEIITLSHAVQGPPGQVDEALA